MSDTHAWLNNYRDHNTVEGWVNNHAFGFLHVIHDALNASKPPVPGGVLEIGVHHGKFFIALNGLVADETSKSIAVDLYENQDLNIDFSGRGSRSHFENNLRQFDRHGGRNVIIESADSTTVAAADLLAKAGQRFKVVSVDGGHTAEHTIADMNLANEVVHSQQPLARRHRRRHRISARPPDALAARDRLQQAHHVPHVDVSGLFPLLQGALQDRQNNTVVRIRPSGALSARAPVGSARDL